MDPSGWGIETTVTLITLQYNLQQIDEAPMPVHDQDDHENTAGLLELQPRNTRQILSLTDMLGALARGETTCLKVAVR